MLYFSKLKIIIIYSVIAILSLFSLANIFDNDDNFLLSKKVNLGLDLQGGSYLLLEVDIQPIIKRNLQNKVISLRKVLKEKEIKYTNLKIKKGIISFKIPSNELEKFENFFLNKENLLNSYYESYNSYQRLCSVFLCATVLIKSRY